MGDPYYGIRDTAREGKVESAYASDNRLWRTEEDRERIAEYQRYENFYDGKHCKEDDGEFPHPYGAKGKKDDIPYIQENMMAKCSRIYADMIVSSGVEVFSSDVNANNILVIQDFGLRLWEALLRASYEGFVGLKPIEETTTPVLAKKNPGRIAVGEKYWSWDIVDPCNLYPTFNKISHEVEDIKVKILFKDVQVDRDKIDILWEETHLVGKTEFRLYWVTGNEIIKELPFSYLWEYMNPGSPEVPQVYEHGLDGFFISLLINEKRKNKIFSDYTNTIIKNQESLNRRKTQIDRILTQNADPRLIMPRAMAEQDTTTGENRADVTSMGVIFSDPQYPDPVKYLTWNGELSEATSNRDNTILAIYNEFDVSPQLGSHTHLVSGTTAETAEKLRQMMTATLNRAGRKRDNLDNALSSLVRNILDLSNFKQADFSIEYPEFIPTTREEKLAEVVTRNQSNLIATPEALEMLDGVSKDEAQKMTMAIYNEQAQYDPNAHNDVLGFKDRLSGGL